MNFHSPQHFENEPKLVSVNLMHFTARQNNDNVTLLEKSL